MMVTLIPVILSVNPGVEVKLTEKGIEYGEQSYGHVFFLPASQQPCVIKLFLF